MTTRAFDLSWQLFTDPPDEPETHYGAMLVNWNGSTGRDMYAMAMSYRTAAFRLLDAANKNNEAWESIDPILFCFRHALELNLKELHKGTRKHIHGFKELADALHTRLSSRYPQVQVNWLRDRICEFDSVDPRSTAFRYDNVSSPNAAPELWVDFTKLRHIMNSLFEGLDTIRRHDLERERGAA